MGKDYYGKNGCKTVRPDFGIKRSPYFPTVAQKVVSAVSTYKVMFLK